MWTLQEIFVFTVIFIVALISVIVLVKMKKIRICQAVSFLVLLIYLAVVFASTVFTRNPGAREYQLELFWSWKEIIGIEPLGRLGSCSSAKELLVENLLNMFIISGRNTDAICDGQKAAVVERTFNWSTDFFDDRDFAACVVQRTI